MPNTVFKMKLYIKVKIKHAQKTNFVINPINLVYFNIVEKE
jgi:hypothetical protein